ncbi:MAG: dihydrolipoyl dehydrogenase [Holosporales bacterium]|nr:dihydrolipoyl dehydrogenase [Holosporales bacterium]
MKLRHAEKGAFMTFDVVVIGGGPGGYVCAIKSAQLGLSVAIIDKKESLGGTCLNKGCIPTKTMLQSAKVKHLIESSSEFGVNSSVASINFDKIIERSRKIISGLNRGVEALLMKNKITLVEGIAKFKDESTLTIEKNGQFSEVKGKNIVISTGAIPKLIPEIEQSVLESGLIWTSKEAIFPSFLPKKLLIVGSGAIGIELASFYNLIGSEVTVVEVMDRILIQEDEEVANAAFKSFTKQGINIKTGVRLQNFKKEAGKVYVELTEKDSKTAKEFFDVVVLAVGVSPNVKDLGLDKIGIQAKQNGTIETDEFCETNVKGIYAIGDVIAPPWLAHKASREGIVVAEKMAKQTETTPINIAMIPSCTYSYPQIASIGLSEEKARNSGEGIKIGRSHFRGNGKAIIAGEPEGFVKVIFNEKTGELLGAHMFGSEVTELIPFFSLAIAGELTERELMAAIFPHPTLSECLQEAVYDAFEIAIHG